MPDLCRLSVNFSAHRIFALLALALLLISPLAVGAQDNANGANSNNVNQNVNANRNANTNNNGNINSNTNRNSNTNTNTNTGQNSNSNQTSDASAKAASEAQKPQGRFVDGGWYPILITALFAAVLIPFGAVITRAIRFSKATFSSPLGLPEGSLRAIIAYLLVAFLGFYVYASVLSLTDFKPPEYLLGIVATVIGFYFGSRTNEDRGATVARTGTVQGNVKDKSGTTAAGATVELSQAGAPKHTQTADTSGNFVFSNIPVGTYDIEATLAGHGPNAPAKVTVATGAPQSVSLKLT